MNKASMVPDGEATPEQWRLFTRARPTLIQTWRQLREDKPDGDLDLVAHVRMDAGHCMVMLVHREQLLAQADLEPDVRREIAISAFVAMADCPMPPRCVRDAIWVMLLDTTTGDAGLLTMGWPRAMSKGGVS